MSMECSFHVHDIDNVSVTVDQGDTGHPWVDITDGEGTFTLFASHDEQQALAGAWLNAIAEARDVPIEATVPHRDVHTTARGERIGVGQTSDGHPALIAFDHRNTVTVPLDGDTRRWLRGHLDRLDTQSLGWGPA